MDTLSTAEILDAELDDWRLLATALHARFLTGDFGTGVSFVESIAEAAEQAGHHPDIKLTYPCVEVRLVSHDADGITERDLDLAQVITDIAEEADIESDPDSIAVLEIGLDTADLAAQGPFWAALLTGDPDVAGEEDVVDPTGQMPTVWFQPTEAHRPPVQRFHVDVWVPHDVAEDRVAAAVAAGGTVVDDSESPSFVVLSDPEGNRVCVCTCLDRD